MLNLEELLKLQTELSALNVRVLNEKLSETEREAARKKTVELANRIAAVAEKGDAPVYIINLTKRRHILHRSWGSYWIGGRGNVQFSSTVIAPTIVSKQAGPGWNKKTETVYCRARQIAEDLCKEINGDLLDLGVSSSFTSYNTEEGPKLRKTLGVFVSDSSLPTKEALAKEMGDLRNYYSALCDEADAIYGKARDRKQLTNLHFEAAAYLGIDDREWTLNYLSQVNCPGCGGKVSNRAALCLHCGWIMKPDAVREQNAVKQKLGLAAKA